MKQLDKLHDWGDCVLTREIIGGGEGGNCASRCGLQVSTPFTDIRVESLKSRRRKGRSLEEMIGVIPLKFIWHLQ